MGGTEEEGFEPEQDDRSCQQCGGAGCVACSAVHLEESGPWPPPPEAPAPEPDTIQGFVAYLSSFGGLTGRGVVSKDGGLTWS